MFVKIWNKAYDKDIIRLNIKNDQIHFRKVKSKIMVL